MEYYQIPKLPMWLKDCPHPVSIWEKFKAKRLVMMVLIFKAKLFGCKEYGDVYLIWSESKKRFYVDLERGYYPHYSNIPPKD